MPVKKNEPPQRIDRRTRRPQSRSSIPVPAAVMLASFSETCDADWPPAATASTRFLAVRSGRDADPRNFSECVEVSFNRPA